MTVEHICDGQWRYYCEACSGLPDNMIDGWKPIETLTIGHIGKNIDLKSGDHEWTIELTGIDAELHTEPEWLELHLSTTGMTECADTNYEWRPRD